MNTNFTSDADRPDWICCQLGAREHYAVPRSLMACGHRVHLLTDVWAARHSRWWMPGRWKQRCHEQVPSGNVTSWNVSALSLQAQLACRRLSMWSRIRATDNWFQARCSQALPKLVDGCRKVPIVFAYSYCAKGVFETAKSLGCRTILGQIDPGPVEMRLVQKLEARHGFTDIEWPSADYWDNWKDECRLADTIVVNSDWSRRALLEEGIDGAKICVVPLAYEKNILPANDERDLPEHFSTSRPLRVLFLGQVNLRKGTKELIEAIRLLQGAPVEWTVVGGGDPRLMKELTDLPQTVVTGPVSRHDVRGYYQDADVFILPTHSDGFALTQLEAAAYGLPIVASEFCGDVVRNEVNGLRLSDVTGSAIADAVQKLAVDTAYVQALSRAQRQLGALSLKDLGMRFLSLPDSGRRNAA